MAMKALALILVFLVGAPALPCSLGAPGTDPAVAHYRGSHVSMGTTYRIQLYGAGRDDLPLVAERAFDEVDRIDRLMSVYKRNSAVSFINRRAGREPVPVEPELFDFLQRCLAFSRQSRGAFDVTVQPLMRAWGFFRRPGSPAARDRASQGAAEGGLPQAQPGPRPTYRPVRPGRHGSRPGRHCKGLCGRPGGQPLERIRNPKRPGERGRKHCLRLGSSSRKDRLENQGSRPGLSARPPEGVPSRSRSRTGACLFQAAMRMRSSTRA